MEQRREEIKLLRRIDHHIRKRWWSSLAGEPDVKKQYEHTKKLYEQAEELLLTKCTPYIVRTIENFDTKKRIRNLFNYGQLLKQLVERAPVD